MQADAATREEVLLALGEFRAAVSDRRLEGVLSMFAPDADATLIGSSLGRPQAVTAGRRCSCSRCDAAIAKGEKCYDVPRPSKPFSAPRRFCAVCWSVD